MTSDLRAALEPLPTTDLRMNAYYYGFSQTGEEIIDRILSAVACAGKAYHNTESWTDECEPYEDVHRGNSCAEWIQNAAEDAAAYLRRARSALAGDGETEALVKRLRAWADDYEPSSDIAKLLYEAVAALSALPSPMPVSASPSPPIPAAESANGKG